MMSAHGLSGDRSAAADVGIPSILLVDDSPANLLALEAVLAPLKLRLVRASSGAEALRHLLKEDFALVLLDVQMPTMDGFETALAMKGRPRTAEIPVVFITALSREAVHVFKGYECGALDYILKPFDPAILKAKVAVFVELYTRGETIKDQTKLLHQSETAARERRNEQRYQGLTDSMPLIVCATHADGTVRYVNRAGSAYSWLSSDKTNPFVDALSLHPDDVAVATATWKSALATGAAFESQVRLRRNADGAHRWHLARGVAERNEHGAIDGWIVTATDIEAQKHTEQAAEAASRMKDEFLANLSHELRTPLSAIIGWARMLRSKLLEPERAELALETIERNAILQSGLIEDLLDVSSIISGKLRLTPQRIDGIAAMSAAVDGVRPAADAKGVVLDFVSAAPATEISADPTRLHQIVSNLVTNAVKFTPKGGHVGVLVARADQTLELTVTDSGAGIPLDFLPYAFDRFRQADNTSTRSHPGLGLGLGIVRHLVELHGGHVTAESAGPGLGATFRVSLPVHLSSTDVTKPEWCSGTEAEVKPRLGARRLDGLSILFVDDNADLRELTTEILESCGAAVIATDSVSSALAALTTNPVHVLVSDIGLPDEDGYALIRKVRALASDCSRVPAIAVSGFSGPEHGRRALAEGFTTFLPKPVDPTALVDLVASLAGAVEVVV